MALQSAAAEWPCAGGYRPENLGGDATLYLLTAATLLEAFFSQHGWHGCDKVQLEFWVDVLSFDGHHAELHRLLDNLQDAAGQLQRRWALMSYALAPVAQEARMRLVAGSRTLMWRQGSATAWPIHTCKLPRPAWKHLGAGIW